MQLKRCLDYSQNEGDQCGLTGWGDRPRVSGWSGSDGG